MTKYTALLCIDPTDLEVPNKKKDLSDKIYKVIAYGSY